jgi:zinc/manganese transport system permease protein
MVSNELIQIVGPAFAVGLIIALTHAPLGLEVLKRGIIFIDLAIAQFAGLGVVTANIIWESPAWWLVQFSALSFALLAALIFRLVEKKLPKEQEAIIGTSFVLAASIALLVLADRPHGGEEIQHLLSGQILFVTWHEVMLHAPIYASILALWFFKPEKARKSGLFYLLFAIAITSSVQLVGVYVVFASLIIPALAAAKSQRKQLVAWTCGIVAVSLGIFAAVAIDAPAGPVIVLAYAVVALFIRVYFVRKLLILQTQKLP